jgi:uncharacterized protein
MEEKINLFMKKLKEMPDFDRVKFVFLYGSYIKNKQNKFSDIDFAIYFNGNDKERFKFRLKLLGNLPDNFDVQIFQDLPLFVRMNVLKGKVVYCADEDILYDAARDTVQRFESFKEYYYDYINTRRTKNA